MKNEESQLRVVIVDDEPQSHLVLKTLIKENHPDFKVIGSAYAVQEGYDLILKLKPDILFLDIELPDGLGFDLMAKIEEPDFMVIFISAHQHYALRAIDFGAFDYLLKPDIKEALAKALEKVRKTKEKETAVERMKLLLQTYKDMQENKLSTRMSVSNMDGIYFFDIKDIIRLEAQKNYTLFRILGSDKNYLASKNLGTFLSHFEVYPQFMQVHRGHLVNLYYVVKFIRSESILIMKNGDEVPVSRNYRDDIIGGIEGI